MTWLYLPSECLVSAPEAEDSTSVSSSPWASDYAPFVTVNGKATQWPRSWRGWKMRPWIARLSGMTLAPSTADRGVERWISSLAATPASHSPVLDVDWETLMSGICGRMSPALLTRYALPSASLKMSQGTLLSDSKTSAKSYRAWVSALHRDCTRRLKLARRTNGSAYSFWPTPDISSGNRDMSTIDPEAQKRPNTKRTIVLPTVAAMWPTPTASQAKQGQNDWDGKRGQTLIGAARGQFWSTPEATAGTNGGPNCRDSSGRMKLAGQAAQWMSPRGHESGNYQFDPKMGVNKATLTGQAMSFGLPDQVTSMDGDASSNADRVLNPQFTEAVMGWPIGMTDCDLPVTGLFQWWQPWRSWIFGDNSSIDECCLMDLGGA